MSANPWVSIWTEPRATIRRIVTENPNRSIWILAAIYGFSSLLNLFQSISLGNVASVFWILFLAFLCSPIWGYFIFSFWSFLVFSVAKIFKGKGSFLAVRAAFSWSCVPLFFSVFFWLVLAAIFGTPLFFAIPEGEIQNHFVLFLFVLLIAKVILVIWSFVIYLNALSEVEQFSVLRAIGSVLLSAVILFLGTTLFWMVIFQFVGVLPNFSQL